MKRESAEHTTDSKAAHKKHVSLLRASDNSWQETKLNSKALLKNPSWAFLHIMIIMNSECLKILTWEWIVKIDIRHARYMKQGKADSCLKAAGYKHSSNTKFVHIFFWKKIICASHAGPRRLTNTELGSGTLHIPCHTGDYWSVGLYYRVPGCSRYAAEMCRVSTQSNTRWRETTTSHYSQGKSKMADKKSKHHEPSKTICMKC